MFSQTRALKLSNPSCMFLLLLSLQHAAATQIEIFSDSSCINQIDHWIGPNGYPNGDCTSLRRDGNFTSFQVVNPDPGCAVTLYTKDETQDICSGKAKQIVGKASTCYDATWYYYSIDMCFKPGASSVAASSSSLAASSSSVAPSSSTSLSSASTTSTSRHTTLQTHTRASSSATATSVPHHHAPNIGAIVGGTIGGVVAGAVLATLGIICFIRRRRAKGEGRHRGGSTPPPYDAMEVAAKEAPMRTTTWGSQDAHELSTEQAVELETKYVHELPTPTATQGSGSPILGKRGIE